MSSDVGNFLMFLAALALQRWKPQATAARALRVLVWSALAFVSGLALLFSLLTPTVGFMTTYILPTFVFLFEGMSLKLPTSTTRAKITRSFGALGVGN